MTFRSRVAWIRPGDLNGFLGLALDNVTGLVILASLLIGSLPGILVGSHLAARVPERFLRNSLAAVLLLAGTKLVMH